MLMPQPAATMVPKEHPIRAVKRLCDAALKGLSSQLDEMYAAGVDSAGVATEGIALDGALLGAERAHVCDQLGYGMLFGWFLDME